MYKLLSFSAVILLATTLAAQSHPQYHFPGRHHQPQPSSGEQITKGGVGIYGLPAGEMPGQTVDLKGAADVAMWDAPYISGMALRSTWSMIQAQTSSTYDWSFFDGGLALAKGYGKKISLSVAAGGFCPTWLSAAGAKSLPITVNLSFKAGPQQQAIVLPWDPIFLSNWTSFVNAMGARYDGDPEVSYVYIGGAGDYIESFFIQNQADYENFEAAGGLGQWQTGVEKLIDAYMKAFPTTPCMLAIGNPINIPPSRDATIAAEDAAGQAAVSAVITYGLHTYPGHFGVVSQGLNSDSDDPVAAVGPDFYVNQFISANSPSGFQMVGSSTQGTAGDLQDSLNAGIELGAGFIEVYKADCLNPLNVEALTDANATLMSTN